MARENRTWGYDRIVGTLCNLGHRISDQTVGNILRRSQIAPRRSGVARPPARWHRLLHVEVLTWRGLITYYILFFIEIGSRRLWLGSITRYPDSCGMEQLARNATIEGTGYLNRCR